LNLVKHLASWLADAIESLSVERFTDLISAIPEHACWIPCSMEQGIAYRMLSD
jgi:hypothetical protein